MAQNGELRVLKILSKLSTPKCVFDVGANIGAWSRAASELWPACPIHAFEIVPSTYEELVANTKNLKNMIANNFGLSNKEGTVPISLGSMSLIATGCKIEGMKAHEEFYTQEIQGKVRKASDYLKERAIEAIDFLKVDVEGMDFKVIKGFEERIKNVRVVQFEYGIFNVASHDLLNDFCQHFKANGFVVGKIFPKTVRFFDYYFNMENFHGSNYLAVRSDEKELISKLSKCSR